MSNNFQKHPMLYIRKKEVIQNLHEFTIQIKYIFFGSHISSQNKFDGFVCVLTLNCPISLTCVLLLNILHK